MLITLVIIGVIAAITVPTLIAKHQKQAFATAFKKSYSIVSQALMTSQSQNGPLNTWEYPTENSVEAKEAFAKRYIIPYFQISKDCGVEGGKGCFAPNTIYKKITGANYSTNGIDNTEYYKVVLNDGTSLLINFLGNCIEEKTRCVVFQVDINGHKKPNQIGRDFYSFSAYPFTNNLIPDGIYTGEYNPETKSWVQNSIEAINTDCDPKNSPSPGWQCAGKMMIEGWQMNY